MTYDKKDIDKKLDVVLEELKKKEGIKTNSAI